MSSAEEIKARINIVGYITSQGVPLKKVGKHWTACCPFHAENTPSFKVDEDKQFFKCFGCGKGGDLFKFVEYKFGWTFSEALTELALVAGVTLEHRGDRQRHARTERTYSLLSTLAEMYQRILLEHPQAEGVRGYLAERGISIETARHFGLGWHPGGNRMAAILEKRGYTPQEIVDAGVAVLDNGALHDRLSGRLIFPIHDGRGRVVAFSGRRLDGQKDAKYINTPETDVFHKSDVLYGYNLARDTIRTDEAVVIVEGYIDVIAAHQAGFTNVVAQMGTSLTDGQMKLLAGVKRITVALDGDVAGKGGTKRSVEMLLKTGRDIFILTLPPGQDPDNIIRAGRWTETISAATPVANYLIQLAVAELSSGATPIEREAVAKKYIPALMAVESDIYKMDNIQTLAVHLNLPAPMLMQMAAPPAAATPQETEPAVKSASGFQAYVIRALLDDREPSFYYYIRGRFTDLESPFGIEDFTDGYREIYRVVQAALDDFSMSVDEYVQANLDEELLPLYNALGTEQLTESMVIYSALQLRMNRIQAELEMTTCDEDLTNFLRCLRQKALIQECIETFAGKV